MRGIAARIDPEVYEQSQGGLTFTRYGLVKAAGGRFSEINTDSNQFAIERPGGGHHIDPEKALANNRGYVFAAVNAKAREVQNIDFRLFEVDGKDHQEKTDHAILDLLDGVNPDTDRLGAEVSHLIASRPRGQLLLAPHGQAYFLAIESTPRMRRTATSPWMAMQVLAESADVLARLFATRQQ